MKYESDIRFKLPFVTPTHARIGSGAAAAAGNRVTKNVVANLMLMGIVNGWRFVTMWTTTTTRRQVGTPTTLPSAACLSAAMPAFQVPTRFHYEWGVGLRLGRPRIF